MEYLYLMFLINTDTYNKIVELKPDIDKVYAIELSQVIDKHSATYNVPSESLVKLAYIESKFKLNAINKITKDFGIMQINIRNIKAYNLDKSRLLNDADYSVESGAKVFAYFYHRYASTEEAIRRYNCGVKKACIKFNNAYWNKYVSI